MTGQRTVWVWTIIGFLLLAESPTLVWAEGPDLSFGDASFSLQYFKQSYNASTNLVVSPVAVRLAFSLLYPVADGTSRELLRRAFYLPAEPTDAVGNAEGFVGDLERSRFVNASFNLLKINGRLSESLENATRTIFRVEPRTVVFTDRRGIVDEVNEWAATATGGRIRNYLTEPDVDVSAELMLLSALYMRANWAQQFVEDRTILETFRFRDGPAEVPLMSATLEVLYHAQEKLHSIQLPYSEDSDLTMWILLPHRGGTFEELLDQLSEDLLDELETSAMPKMVDLWLPKFTIADRHDARDVLKRMGFEALFDRDGFSVFEGRKSSLGQMKQSAFFQVDEKGTEAAAVTSVGTIFRARNKQFPVTQPFVFIVKKISTDTILFVGHYSNRDQPAET